MDARPTDLSQLENRVIGPIDRVELVSVRLPFVSPFGTSVHTWTVKEALLLRVESGGVTGWGECVADPDPFYFYETTATARHIIKDFLLPVVEPGLTLGELAARFRRVRGHGMAKATIENALLNLIAIQKDVPLHALLGRVVIHSHPPAVNALTCHRRAKELIGKLWRKEEEPPPIPFHPSPQPEHAASLVPKHVHTVN